MKREQSSIKRIAAPLVTLFLAAGFTMPATAQKAIELSDEQVENIVRRSYQYVAMYNVNNKFAMDPSNPLGTGGWNRIKANTTLADHSLKAIARPNNDTLYVVVARDRPSAPRRRRWSPWTRVESAKPSSCRASR